MVLTVLKRDDDSMERILLFVLLIWAMATTCLAAVAVTDNEKWGNIFCGEETRFTFSISADKPFHGTAGWRFSIGGRTIARGETAADILPGGFQTMPVGLPVPDGKEGMVLFGMVTVSVYDQNNRAVVAKHEKEIRIFPKNPFREKQHWLTNLNLALFDPEMKTAQVFTESKIQYKEIYNREVISEIRNGIVLIGENVSLSAYPGLARMLIRLAASGIPVICLAPREGAIPLDDAVADIHAPGPSAMLFSQSKIIKQLDKTLDAGSWPPDGRVVQSYLRLKGDKHAITAIVNKHNKGWPWLEIQYNKGNGRLIVCGFGIIEKWDAGPTPRHLLLRLLEYVDGKNSS